MIGCPTSVHETTGYTKYSRVYGQELGFPVHFMNRGPTDHSLAIKHEDAFTRQISFENTYDSARAPLDFNQRRKNAFHKRKIQGSDYPVDQIKLLDNPVFQMVNHPVFAAYLIARA